MKKTICILLLLVLILTGCTGPVHAPTDTTAPPEETALTSATEPQMPELDFEGENVGTTCSNICIGGGQFAYQNGVFYFKVDKPSVVNSEYFICSYDSNTGKTASFSMPFVDGDTSAFLHASKDFVYWGASCVLHRVTGDFSLSEKVCDFIDGIDLSIHQLYMDGTYAYLLRPYDGIHVLHPGREELLPNGGELYRIDLQTGERVLLMSYVLGFDMDDDWLYIVAEDGDGFSLFRGARNGGTFTRIDLSFSPVNVLVAPDGLYMVELDPDGGWPWGGVHQIIRYADGEETRLPIYGYYFQVLDGNVIYREDAYRDKDSGTLKCYNVQTGALRILDEASSGAPSVFEGRYVCYFHRNWDTLKEEYRLYDWQTGKITVMYQS